MISLSRVNANGTVDMTCIPKKIPVVPWWRICDINTVWCQRNNDPEAHHDSEILFEP